MTGARVTTPPAFFDRAAYAAAAGTDFADAAAAYRHYRVHGVARGIAPHPMFHLPWYRSQHPEVGDGDPLAHFLAQDRRIRTPHPLFDPVWYARQYSDVARGVADPTLHYWLFGGRERRDPSPAFPVTRYLALHPDLDLATTNPLAHHVRHHAKTAFRAIGRVVVLDAPARVRPGAEVGLHLRIENDTGLRWMLAGPAPAALGIRWFPAAGGPALAGERRPPPVPLLTGARFWMRLETTAPETDRPCRLQLSLLYLDAPWPADTAPETTTVDVFVDRAQPRRPPSRWSVPEQPPAAVLAEQAAIGRGGPLPGAPLARRMQRDDGALRGRPFAAGRRPVIRWIKGDGLDDLVTRAAIGRATRLFGNRVDYCLCTNGIGGARARMLLSQAEQPVEWWPLGPDDNPWLARRLRAAGCDPDRFGYWWKWFPERVRPDAPEWILDGDQALVDAPAWFEAWCAGHDPLRLSQDGRWLPHGAYGAYLDLVDPTLKLYSGLASLPPGFRFRPHFEAVLDQRALAHRHDGRRDTDEQGVAAVAFQRAGALPIPLDEFPFARAGEDQIDFGPGGDRGVAWGYHFGSAFRHRNRHFERMAQAGMLPLALDDPPPLARFRWLMDRGQWGGPGWSSPEPTAARILAAARRHAGGDALEIGTSRGRLAALLASQGLQVTTVDLVDRGGAANLAGLGVTIVIGDGVAHAERGGRDHDLVVVDLHGNGPDVWRRLWPAVVAATRPGGTLIVANVRLSDDPVWHAESGLRDVMPAAMPGWTLTLHREPAPGLAIWRREPAALPT